MKIFFKLITHIFIAITFIVYRFIDKYFLSFFRYLVCRHDWNYSQVSKEDNSQIKFCKKCRRMKLYRPEKNKWIKI
jgi:hypothetical protein